MEVVDAATPDCFDDGLSQFPPWRIRIRHHGFPVTAGGQQERFAATLQNGFFEEDKLIPRSRDQLGQVADSVQVHPQPNRSGGRQVDGAQRAGTTGYASEQAQLAVDNPAEHSERLDEVALASAVRSDEHVKAVQLNRCLPDRGEPLDKDRAELLASHADQGSRTDRGGKAAGYGNRRGGTVHPKRLTSTVSRPQASEGWAGGLTPRLANSVLAGRGRLGRPGATLGWLLGTGPCAHQDGKWGRCHIGWVRAGSSPRW